MKQSQKTLRTRQRILSAAIEEFGAYGYEKGSINRICSENGILKAWYITILKIKMIFTYKRSSVVWKAS